MNTEFSRREWMALTVAAGAAAEARGAEPQAARGAWSYPKSGAVPKERCPYFDQPLFCCGEKHCEK